MPYADRARNGIANATKRKQNRADYFRGKVCVECGTSEDLIVLHEDDTQKIAKNLWVWNDERRWRTLRNCRAICKTCASKYQQRGNKLNVDDVIEIKHLLRTGELTHRQIAKLYNVCKATIANISCGKSWKHV